MMVERVARLQAFPTGE